MAENDPIGRIAVHCPAGVSGATFEWQFGNTRVNLHVDDHVAKIVADTIYRHLGLTPPAATPAQPVPEADPKIDNAFRKLLGDTDD